MNKDIYELIENLRKKMVSVGMSNGFTSEETISLSQELDHLLNQGMELLRKTSA